MERTVEKKPCNNLVAIYQHLDSPLNLSVSVVDSSPQEILDAITLVFYIRSIRSGAGLRYEFYRHFLDLYSKIPYVMDNLFEYIVNPFTGGYWKDLLHLTERIRDSHSEAGFIYFSDKVAEFFAKQLFSDYVAVSFESNKNISLAAKYAPSEKTAFWGLVGKKIAVRLYVIQFSKMSSPKEMFKNYRQVLSIIRSKLPIVERQMCSEKWAQIDFDQVPTKARRRYSKRSFPNLDVKGFRKSYEWDRIKCATNFGHYISTKEVSYYRDIELQDMGYFLRNFTYDYGSSPLVEIESKVSNLVHNTRESLVQGEMFSPFYVIPFIDISTTMHIGIQGWNFPSNISGILGQTLSRCNIHPAFKNKSVVFSEYATWFEYDESSNIQQNFRKFVEYHSSSRSRNFAAALGFLLDYLILNEIPPEDLGKMTILCFTCVPFEDSYIDFMRNRYQENGYNLPRIISWNLASYTDEGTTEEEGLVCVNGMINSKFIRRFMELGTTNIQTEEEEFRDAISNPAFNGLREKAKSLLISKYGMVFE